MTDHATRPDPDTRQAHLPPTQYDARGRPLPPQATMGLLNYLTATSLDEDYRHVSSREPVRAAHVRESGRRTRRHLGTLVVLALFGGLVVTAGVQTSRSAPVREQSQEQLVTRAQQQREDLDDARSRLESLRTGVDDAQATLLSASTTGRTVQGRLERLGVAAGFEPVTGPGVRIVVDDARNALTDRQKVYDTDLQILANGLWSAGAEAVAINGQRLTALSAIREAGSAVNVNFRPLSRPYTVTAIGDPEQLPARFLDSDGGTWWLNLKAVYGHQFQMTSEDTLTLPAASAPLLRHARPLTGPSGEGQ